ncbi:MAG: metal-dependent hydrolase, beta-lactamase superfamily [Blastococcus sp.]|nr:metal-dependent hydrolase, beta-lactamase superfamily [Blastococcus sp.]
MRSGPGRAGGLRPRRGAAAFAGLAPAALVPAHCTGRKAEHRFAAALPDAFVPNAVGTSYTFAAAAGPAARPILIEHVDV